MVRSFQVSAPGKVILHGEHSVVYGKAAIAGVVQVRNNLIVREIDGTVIKVNFAKLGLHNLCLDTTSINGLINRLCAEYPEKDLPLALDHEKFLRTIQEFVKNSHPNLDGREMNSIVAVVYLLVGIFTAAGLKSGLERAFELELQSEISIGAGLGSSASYGVCVAGAFLILSNSYQDGSFLQLGRSDQEKLDFLHKTSAWAFQSERIMHGSPSGLDNTVCTFGNIVKFYRGQTPEPISLHCSIPILLVNSKVSRSTAALVQRVVELKNQHPLVVQCIFDAIGHLTEDAVALLKAIKCLEEDAELFKQLENLVAMNNNLLRALNVSHPELEKIFAIAEGNGFKAKLSGAGGGGFAMILLGDKDPKRLLNYDKMRTELMANDFELIETTLGGPGIEYGPL